MVLGDDNHREVVLRRCDLEEWRVWESQLEVSDVFVSPDYLIPFESEWNQEAILYVLESGQDFVYYPFLRRSLTGLPYFEAIPRYLRDLSDIVSPYGYSGPVAVTRNGNRADLWNTFRDRFHSFCLRQGYIAEFVRLSPFLGNMEALGSSPDGAVVYRGDILSVDLTQAEADIWQGLRKGHRYSIKRARTEKIVIRPGVTAEDTNTFHTLYTDTMDRLHASSHYYFSKEFLHSLQSHLGPNASLSIAEYRGIPVSAAMFLHQAGNIVHYFLAGADAAYSNVSANHLLLFTAILRFRSSGYRSLNLGGGWGATEDGLFRFKSGFPAIALPFHTLQYVHMPGAYHELSKLRDEWTITESSPGYFPEYRSP